MKKFVMGFVIGAVMMVSFTAMASEGYIVKINERLNLVFNGERVQMTDQMLLINDKTYVPLRSFFEDVLDGVVGYDADTSTINVVTQIYPEAPMGVEEIEEQINFDLTTIEDEIRRLNMNIEISKEIIKMSIDEGLPEEQIKKMEDRLKKQQEELENWKNLKEQKEQQT